MRNKTYYQMWKTSQTISVAEETSWDPPFFRPFDFDKHMSTSCMGEDVGPQFISLPSYHYGFINSNTVRKGWRTRAGEQNACNKHNTFVPLWLKLNLNQGKTTDDSMQYDDTALEYEDLGQQEDDDPHDVASGAIFSECFQTCVQQLTCGHGLSAINTPMLHGPEQMPLLIEAYMRWAHNMTETSGDQEGHSFGVAAVGIMVQPTVAIHLHCLELYHQIRRRQSSFSVQSITKVLCTLHNVTYSRHLQEQFMIAFDIYLQVKREVRRLIDRVLNQDGADWHLKGSCPSCAFEQPNEPPLVPCRLHSMDGNHSAKRLDGLGRYFIPVSAVEQFRDDVHNRPGERSTRDNITCTKKWTAAKSVEEDKISVFEQTGIFILACRHGFVECIAEMKRSGELMDLPVVSRLLEVCGQDQGLGHDIGCSSHKTIAASSIGNLATQLNLVVTVNAFHGSNGAAVLIHHSSYFHWMQFIDLHFDQWDQDKYLELSHFLHDNYVQALSIIEEHTRLLEEFMTRKSVTKDNFIRWQQEESEFLRNLAKEPPSDAIAAAYVDELKKLYVAEHGITERWMPMHHGYTPALEYSHERHFVQIVEELEGLVIQCLFELSKANLAGTGYKMRKYISKAITRRSAAIRNALEKYNKLAPLQTPPRPILDYAEVVGYATLGEFTLLKYSRHEFSCKTMGGHLDAWVEYDDKKMLEVIEMLVTDDPSSLLAAELRKQYSVHHRINDVHRCHLHRIRQLEGYNGPFPVMQHDVTEKGQDDEGSGDYERTMSWVTKLHTLKIQLVAFDKVLH
ncbi:hypothetical protein DFH29DRAFT_880019 [Suillus ampliporus]|nr:hypothetical protein DFH29DRAFT_880019 [Suillus ampliporus]